MIRTDQHRLDPGRPELDPQGRATAGDRCAGIRRHVRRLLRRVSALHTEACALMPGPVRDRCWPGPPASAAPGSGCRSAPWSRARTSCTPAPAELGEVLAHRRQRRREVRRLGQVVEADDADVPGHREPLLVQRGEQAERHLVVGEEHRRDAVPAPDAGGQQLARRVARRRRPVAARAARAPERRPPRSSERQPSMRARASCESAGPVTWCTVRWPSVEQVPGGQPGTGLLVDPDGRPVLHTAHLDGDERHRGVDRSSAPPRRRRRCSARRRRRPTGRRSGPRPPASPRRSPRPGS